MSKRVFVKLLLYLLPVALYLTVAIGIPAYGGESTPLAEVARLQAGDTPVLYGRAYRDNYFAYKLIATQTRRPEVLVLGSSRSMQFRSMFFDRAPSAFYNAGGAAQSVYEAYAFLEHLDHTQTPRVLIVGLDQSWFNARFTADPLTFRLLEQIDLENMLAVDRAISVGPQVTDDLLHGKIRMDRLFAHTDPVYGVQALGLNAIMGGNGFRNDGSYQYGGRILNPPATAERLAEGFQGLRDDIGQYARGDQVDEAGMAELERLLHYSAEQGIFVIGFSPPFAPSIYEQMMADGRYRYIPQQVQRLQALFDQYGFSYFDFSNPAPVGVTDDDMVDGFHGSEYVILRLYIQMLTSKPEVLGRYSDMEFLQSMVEQAPANRFELFGNWLK